jgi:hypothetical protein
MWTEYNTCLRYSIIGMHNKYKVPFYYCKLHPNIENIYLESIEHHCRFSDPEYHESEILRLLKKILTNHKAKDNMCSVLNSYFIQLLMYHSIFFMSICDLHTIRKWGCSRNLQLFILYYSTMFCSYCDFYYLY